MPGLLRAPAALGRSLAARRAGTEAAWRPGGPLPPARARAPLPAARAAHRVAEHQPPPFDESVDVFRASSSMGTGSTAPGAPEAPSLYEASPHQFWASISTLLLGATLLAERLDGHGLDQMMHPLLVAVVLALGAAAVWPQPRAPGEDAVWGLQRLAGRVSFAALGAAIATEMATGRGALAVLSAEAGLAFLLMLVLSRPASPRRL
eukprot:scaffold3.g6195.t1